ncbi:MAG: hypothetical protein Q4D38_00165 [Planctomycetia bacterium]|nr:hypothetical protein [Planctomycetia bacterium]
MANMLEPELQEVYQQWKMYPGPETNAMLAAKLSPWISQSVVAAGGDPNNKALLAKARMMAIASLNRYNPEQSNMKNFLYAQLRGLHRVVGNDSNIIQMPERMVLGRKTIDEAEKELLEALGRYPSSSELADKTGFSIKQIEKWRHVNLPTNAGGDIADMPGMQRTSNQTKADEAWMEYVYDSMPDRRKAVMERLYGMHGYDPQKAVEVAKQLKISPVSVSQHKKEIDKLLYDDSQYSLFGD